MSEKMFTQSSHIRHGQNMTRFHLLSGIFIKLGSLQFSGFGLVHQIPKCFTSGKQSEIPLPIFMYIATPFVLCLSIGVLNMHALCI